MKHFTVSIGLAAVLAASPGAFGVTIGSDLDNLLPIPNTLTVDGQSVDLSQYIQFLDKQSEEPVEPGTPALISIPTTTFTVGGSDGALITLSGSGDTDPFFALALGFTDLGAPSSFAVLVDVPINPPLDDVIVDASHSYSWSSPNTDISLSGGFVGGTTAVFGVDSGVNLFPTHFLGSGFSDSGTPLFSGNEGPFDGGDVAVDCTAVFFGAPCDTMFIGFAGTGSGNGATYSFNGVINVRQVPEPASIVLIGLGLLGLAARRKRAS